MGIVFIFARCIFSSMVPFKESKPLPCYLGVLEEAYPTPPLRVGHVTKA